MDYRNTQKLISLVSKYPQLYDGRIKEYGDMHLRDVTWQNIAKELGVKAELCKVKWNILRGGYRRALRNRESGYSYSRKKWRFEDDLSFLKDCVIDKRRQTIRRELIEAEGMSENEIDEELSIVKEEPSEIVDETMREHANEDDFNSSCSSDLIKATNQSHGFEKKEESADNVTQLFLSLAETVKTLPPLVQARVKAEVFKAVNLAEVNYLEAKGGTESNGD